MFTPGNSHQVRQQKIDMGLESLLTMSIVLLMLTDYIPKESSSNFPFLGEVNFVFDPLVFDRLVVHR
jgi:hypothetical protein